MSDFPFEATNLKLSVLENPVGIDPGYFTFQEGLLVISLVDVWKELRLGSPKRSDITLELHISTSKR
jgi:hypothetical protein